MEADENGVTAKNTYGGSLLLRTVFGDIETTYQYLYNAHGDVVTLLMDGEVAATYYYDSFGNILDQTGEVDNSILYAGYQYDEETGLYYINARMYDPVTARFLQADTYLGTTNDPLSLNLYTYCLNNPHKYTDPSGHIPLLLIGVALLVGAVSAQAEYKRQVREGDNYTNLVSIGVVGVSNTLLCLIPGGKAVSAYKMATAGGSFVLKTFAVQFGKAVGLGVAAGYATDAGIEVARQLATGTKLSNLEYDRINEAGVTGAIAGGAGAIFGAGVEALANTRVGKSVVAKATEVFGRGKTAVKNGFVKKKDVYESLIPRSGSEWNDYFVGKYGIENVEWTSKKTEIDSILRNLQGNGFRNHPLRQAYEDEVRNLTHYADDLYRQGYAENEIAQLMNQARRDLGIQYKDATPQPLREFIYELNKGRYRDALGPTYEYYSRRGKSDFEIIKSASKPNGDIDKLFVKFQSWMEGHYDTMPH